jgi:hypothetical protein
MIALMRRLITGLAVVGLTFAAAPASRADVTPEYFPIPSDLQKFSGGIAAAPDGTIYFGAGDGFNATPPIGRLDSSAAVPGTSTGFTGVTTPDGPGCCASIFRDLVWSTKDNLLYWSRSDSLVGTLNGETVEKATLNAGPWGMAADPNGGVGVVEQVNIAQQTGVWDGSRYDAKPKNVAVLADGTPWFVEADAGNPGYRLATPGGSGYQEYRPCPTAANCSGLLSGDGLTDIAVGGDGMLWYTNEAKKTVGRFDPVSKTYTEFALATMGPALAVTRPFALTSGPDGSVWLATVGSFANPAANAIVKLVPSAAPTATVYTLGADLTPPAVTVDARGNVWFGGSSNAGVARLGRLSFGGAPPSGGGGSEQPPVTTTPPTTTGPPAVTLTPTVTSRATVTDPTVKGDTISANQICVGPPQDKCSLIYLIQTREYVTGFPGSKGRMAAAKLTTIGRLKVTLTGGQSKQVTIKLNAKGKKLRKKKAFKATLTVTQSINGAKPKQILKKSVRFKK